jgi:hypothetical protein
MRHVTTMGGKSAPGRGNDYHHIIYRLCAGAMVRKPGRTIFHLSLQGLAIRETATINAGGPFWSILETLALTIR